MAQGSLYELAVAYPIVNHKFRLPTRVDTTLATALSGDTFEITDFNFNSNVIQKGDKVILGPNSSNVSENAIVSTVTQSGSNASIKLKSSPTNSFASGDSVTIWGTKLGGGWGRTSGANETDRVLTVTTRPGEGKGASDNYAQFYRQGTTQNSPKGIVQSLVKSLLNSFSYYRFGLMYKIDIDGVPGNGRAFWQMNDGSGALPSQVISTTDQFTWTRFSSNPVWIRSMDVPGGSSHTIYIDTPISGTDKVFLGIDDIFLEHAKGTSSISNLKNNATTLGGGSWSFNIYDQVGTNNFNVVAGDEIAVDDGSVSALLSVTSASTGSSSITAQFISGDTTALVQDSTIQVQNNGMFTFSDYPTRESVEYGIIGGRRSVLLGDGSAKSFIPLLDGDRSERYFFRARFTMFTQADWNKLMVLKRWQEKGELLNFHPFIDDLPTVMMGVMDIRNVTKATHFSLARRDFDFTFEELKA